MIFVFHFHNPFSNSVSRSLEFNSFAMLSCFYFASLTTEVLHDGTVILFSSEHSFDSERATTMLCLLTELFAPHTPPPPRGRTLEAQRTNVTSIKKSSGKWSKVSSWKYNRDETFDEAHAWQSRWCDVPVPLTFKVLLVLVRWSIVNRTTWSRVSKRERM